MSFGPKNVYQLPNTLGATENNIRNAQQSQHSNNYIILV